jgi:putative membrane protein
MARMRKLIATGGLLAVALVTPATMAGAQSGTIESLSQRQSVRAQLRPDGTVSQTRLFTQWLVDGRGRVQIASPTATSGLRNLEGFRAPGRAPGGVVWDLALDGLTTRRTVANYDGDLPVSVEVSYTLDGAPVTPAALVGRSGRVAVTYRVANVTGSPQEVAYKDGLGNRQTETVEVVIPLAGSLSTTLDSRFRNIDAPTAVVAGDGRGNTVLNWTLLLFEPIGANVAEATLTADVTDAVAPAAAVQVVPVVSEGNPLANGITAYSEAADSTFALTSGATTIDRNLVRIAKGAGDLLDGLTRLSDGATQLADGLEGAASGSGELAAGLGSADDGGRRLASGLGELAGGAIQLSDGLASATAGGRTLSGGLVQLSDGSVALSEGLASAAAGGRQVAGGSTQLAGGAGQLSSGLRSAGTGATQVLAGLDQISGGLQQLADAQAGLPAALAGATQLRDGVNQIRALMEPLLAGLPQLAAAADGLDGALAQAGIDAAARLAALNAVPVFDPAAACDGATDPVACQTAVGTANVLRSQSIDATNQLIAGIGGPADGPTTLRGLSTILATQLPGVNAGVQSLAGALGSGEAPPAGTVRHGLGALVNGLENAVNGINLLAPGAVQAASGQRQLATGLNQLDAGGTSLTAGATELAAGATQLSGGLDQLDAGARQLAAGAGSATVGSRQLVDGLNQLDAGGRRLAAGADSAHAGAAQLSDGLGQLAAGGGRLADGLDGAAGGSRRLADGLLLARIGGGQVADGAGRLREQGTSELAGAVNDATLDQTRRVAVLQAAAQRAIDEGLPFAAPVGATATAVYRLELASADGAAGRNATRTVLALVLLIGVGVAGVAGSRRLSGAMVEA